MKILQISMGNQFGGVEILELNLAKNSNKSFKFDLLVPDKSIPKDYIDLMENLGCRIYNMNISRNNIKGKIAFAIRLYKFLKNNKYDVIHIHSSAFFFSFHVALIARWCKNKKIIAHIHSTPKVKLIKRIIKHMLFPVYLKIVDEYLACSKKAGEEYFTKKYMDRVKILKNGIEIEKFKFDENVRKEYREELKLGDSIVYGNTSRFEIEKNYMFLIDIFNEIQKKQKNSKLLLVGDGSLKKEIEKRIEKLGISDKVILLGFRQDINKILNCMDIFILPSIREGLGISAIEAQANGLYTYCSKAIPNEAKISSKFEYFDLKDSPLSIAERMYNTKMDIEYRKKAYFNAIKNGYDIIQVCKELEAIYENMNM